MKIRLTIVLAILLAMALPVVAFAQVTSYTSGFQLQNLDTTNAANVTISFIEQNGNTAASVTDTINANSSKTYFPLGAVSSGFNGSVVVSSTTEVAAIANVLGNNGAYGASYDGFTAGATTVNAPLVMKNNFGISTWFNVQNTGNTDATVNVAYKPGTCTESATIKPGAAKTFDQATNTCLSNGFVGAATVTSSAVPVAATVMQVTGTSGGLKPNLLAYNGFTTASPSPVMPLISSGYYGSGTGIQIQNTGGTDTSVTVSYAPSAGFPGAACTETKTVPAGASTTFGFPNLPVGCLTNAGGAGSAAFVGSAKVTGNTAGHNLVAIVNQVTSGQANAAAYGAFDPATATSKVSLPLIMDRNYNIFTGFSVANVGAQPTNISCTFTGTTYTVSANNVAPGAAVTDVQLNKIASGYVGSATCQATGGDAKISAVVNELTQGASVNNDALLVYEGIGY
jgi:hypothetical protein